MQVYPEKLPQPEAQLQMLLFVDERPSSRQQVERIRHYLKELQADYQFDLQIVDVGEQPYLAEHFKLVATPALIKIYPEPRQTLAGNNLIAQLENWWPRWQNAIETNLKLADRLSEIDKGHRVSTSDPIRSVADSAELIRLTDEVFRFKQEKEKLLEQLQFKDRVIAMLAHDLRNPLTAISIAVETLESNYKPESSHVSRMTPALAMQLFKQARTQTRTIERMIAGLLQVDCGHNAHLHIQPQKLELGPLCEDAIEQLSSRFHAKAQRLETDIPKDLPYVYGDPQKVHQVLMNLLDNASKYTPEGGSIRLSTLHRTTQKIQVSVCDTGPGIPEDYRDCIFADGFRLQRDKAQEGYGIGLSLCQRIIRAHYGQIWVDHSPSGGSCFHFTLPVYPR
ncbi:MAG: histidine kinase [Chroococcidiopsidaceae cyanobacterium CP_BM_RX_35]|nr:histidine kinase [Chroococcidiopsidaceae cyanobacterium CP_BM_RX_35]